MLHQVGVSFDSSAVLSHPYESRTKIELSLSPSVHLFTHINSRTALKDLTDVDVHKFYVNLLDRFSFSPYRTYITDDCRMHFCLHLAHP